MPEPSIPRAPEPKTGRRRRLRLKDLTGDQLRQRRQAVGLSQAALAGLCGVRQASVSRWEADLDRPSRRHAAGLARLGVR